MPSLAEKVDIRTFAESRKYLGLPKLGERQANVLQCFFAPDSGYTELVLLWGKGSGKDHIAGIITLYMVYETLLVPNPQTLYGLAPGSRIDFINVAQSAEQAENVYFEGSLKAKLENSEFFRGMYRATRNTIRFSKNIQAISTHSQNESYEGYNILGWVMDEAAAFRSETKAANADKIYSTLRSSMISRFGAAGKGCILSYPRHERDFIMQKYEESQKHSWILGDKGSTWEINPLRNQKDFKDEYERDPIDAAAKYECLPPLVEDAYFTKEQIAACITGVSCEITDLPVDPRIHYVVSLDPALYADRFGIAVGHRDSEHERAIVDSIRFLQGSRQTPVKIADIESIVSSFAKRTNARVITDSYEIAGSVQKWVDQGIDAEIIGVSTRDQMSQWSTFKNNVVTPDSNRRVQLPNDVELEKELTRLRIKRSSDLWKVEAAEGEYDDLSDAVARLVWDLMKPFDNHKPVVKFGRV